MQLMGAHTFLARAHQVEGKKALVERDMSLLENCANLDRELLAAALLSALTEAKARLAEVVVLRVDRAAMRADRSVGPQHAFKVLKGGGFVVKVGLAENGHGRNLQCRQSTSDCRGLQRI